MQSIDVRDVVGGLLLIVLGLGVAIFSASSYELGQISRMGPGMLPFLLGLSTVAFGVVIAGLALRPKLHDLAVPDIKLRPLIAILLAVLVFALLIERAGLIPTTFITILISAFAEDEFRLKRAAILGAVLAAASWLIFLVALGMTIPAFNF